MFCSDTWVALDRHGERLTKSFPFFQDQQDQQLVKEGKLNDSSSFLSFNIPMSCTWNGLVILHTEPFYRYGVRFRAGLFEAENKPEKVDSAIAPYVSSCAASEITQFCKDLWRVYGTNTRIFVSPSVMVAYDLRTYQTIQLQPWFSVLRSIGENNFNWLREMFVKLSQTEKSQQVNQFSHSEPANRFSSSIQLPKGFATAEISPNFHGVSYTCCDTTQVLSGNCVKEQVRFVQENGANTENNKKNIIQHFLSPQYEWKNDYEQV